MKEEKTAGGLAGADVVETFAERSLTIDDLSFHLTDYRGRVDASPLMCLHGGMAHSRFFDFLAPRLRDVARPFALDRRGHGESDWTEPGNYGFRRDIEDIEAACMQVDPAPWILLGHSQGGVLSVPLALRQRLPLRALILLDMPFDPLAPSMRRTGDRLRRVPQIRYPSWEVATRGFQPYPLPHKANDAVVEHLAGHSFRASDEGGFLSKFHWARMRGPRDPDGNMLADFPDRFREIKIPVLVLRGGESSILPANEYAEMVARFPAATGAEIAGTTHSLHLEKPEAVAEVIRDFLTGLPPA
ncbi:MAG: alpha/beta hydrolase [Deltaproteobacteria bacterium]